MRSFIIICGVLACCCLTMQAQRLIPGEKGIMVTGYTVDHPAFQNGYNIGVYYTHLKTRSFTWLLGGDYTHTYEHQEKICTPFSQFTMEGGFLLQLFKDKRRNVIGSVGLSGLAGYETFDLVHPASTKEALDSYKDRFIFGGRISLQIETFLTDRISLLFKAREQGKLKSNLNTFQYQLGAGIKFNF